MTETTEHRAVVTWEGPGEPIVLTLHGPDGEVALPLLPKRALTLAQELLRHGVSAIKADSWDAMYGQGAAGAGLGGGGPIAWTRRYQLLG